MKPTVYLAGPITGLDYGAATDWRAAAIKTLDFYDIRGISPMRGKEYLSQIAEISGHGRDYSHLNIISTPRAVMTRDRFDATHCDLLLVNLSAATQVSIGTVMEIAWADAHRVPIIAVLPAEGVAHPHDHMLVHEAVGFRVTTLAEALNIAIGILR